MGVLGVKSTGKRDAMVKSVSLSDSALAARGESPMTQKMGTATDFWQSSFLRNKALRRTKIGWQSPFFARDHFYHGLLGRSLTWIWTFQIAVAMAGVASAANAPKKQVTAQTTPKAAVQTGAAKENLTNGRDASKTISIQWGIHLTQVTPTSCGWAHGASASQSATIDRYGVWSTATACCTRR